MAGSPAYLDRLTHLFTDYRIPTANWDLVDARWKKLKEEPRSPYNLQELARVSYVVLARQTGENVVSVIERAKDMHVRKNAGYAGATNPDPWANFRLSEAFGISPFDGVLVRMSDKYIRVTNLRSDASNEQVGESIWDTLFDLAAYALIADCLLEEEIKTTEKEYVPFHHNV